MRWKIPDVTPLKGGELRVVRKFAWRPTVVGNVVVWMESYEIEECYYAPKSGAPGWWTEKERRTLDYYY